MRTEREEKGKRRRNGKKKETRKKSRNRVEKGEKVMLLKGQRNR